MFHYDVDTTNITVEDRIGINYCLKKLRAIHEVTIVFLSAEHEHIDFCRVTEYFVVRPITFLSKLVIHYIERCWILKQSK